MSEIPLTPAEAVEALRAKCPWCGEPPGKPCRRRRPTLWRLYERLLILPVPHRSRLKGVSPTPESK